MIGPKRCMRYNDMRNAAWVIMAGRVLCFRIMSMYDFGEGLEGPLLDYANRKYKSHRRVPSNLNINNLKEEYATYEKKLLIKREQRKKQKYLIN